MTDSLHLSCDNLFHAITLIKSDREILRDNKIISCYDSLKYQIEKLEKILFHVREQALKIEGNHDDQKDVQH